MPNTTIDLSATMDAVEFKGLIVGTSFSTTETVGTLSVKAIAPDSSVDIASLKYSEDGEGYNDVTLINPPGVINASVDGITTVLNWDLGADFGTDYFNKPIYLKFVISVGNNVSPEGKGVFFASKVTSSSEDVRRDRIESRTAIGQNRSNNILRTKKAQ